MIYPEKEYNLNLDPVQVFKTFFMLSVSYYNSEGSEKFSIIQSCAMLHSDHVPEYILIPRYF